MNVLTRTVSHFINYYYRNLLLVIRERIVINHEIPTSSCVNLPIPLYRRSVSGIKLFQSIHIVGNPSSVVLKDLFYKFLFVILIIILVLYKI